VYLSGSLAVLAGTLLLLRFLFHLRAALNIPFQNSMPYIVIRSPQHPQSKSPVNKVGEIFIAIIFD
jgi:hypothetical protein